MTTYKEIFGKPVKVLSSDPTDAGAEGQLWYNTTDGVFKTVLSVGTWSAGGNLGTARDVLAAGGTSTQTAGLAFGGGVPAATGKTEEYDGSSWTNGGDLNAGRQLGSGAGTQTAGLIFGGDANPGILNSTEEYNGTAWAVVNAHTLARKQSAGYGLQTAATLAAGTTGSNVTTVEEYDGTNWTTGTAVATARSAVTGMGTSVLGLIAGGTTGSFSNATEEFTVAVALKTITDS